jgi:type IV secretion system protein VirD4
MTLLETYNPLVDVRMGKEDVKDAMAVAEMITETNNKKDWDHWHRAAIVLLTGVILHTVYSQKDKTLTGVLNILTDLNMSICKLCDSMLVTIHDPQGKFNWVDPITNEPTKTHPVVASIAKEYKAKCYNELSGIVSTALTYLRLYRGPTILNNHIDDDSTVQINVKGGKLGNLTYFTTLSQIEKETLFKGMLTEGFKTRILKAILSMSNHRS